MHASKSGQISVKRAGGSFRPLKQVSGWAYVEHRQRRGRQERPYKSRRMGPDAPGQPAQVLVLFQLDAPALALARLLVQRKPKPEAYAKTGRTQRGGFWQLVPCAVCGQKFERRVRPWRDKKPRKTCSPKCSDEWYRRSKNANKTGYRATHPETAREADKRYRLKHVEKLRADGRARSARRRATPEGRALLNERNREYREKNRDKLNAKARAVYAALPVDARRRKSKGA